MKERVHLNYLSVIYISHLILIIIQLAMEGQLIWNVCNSANILQAYMAEMDFKFNALNMYAKSLSKYY